VTAFVRRRIEAQERSMMAPELRAPEPPPKAARSVIDGSERGGMLEATGSGRAGANRAQPAAQLTPARSIIADSEA
jgi:hypothetical protein